MILIRSPCKKTELDWVHLNLIHEEESLMTRVSKKSKLFKMFAVMLAMILTIACFSVTVSAAEVAPAAISGSGSATGISETFYIYSPANSWFGHMTISVSSQSSATIQVFDPNGRLLTPGGGANCIFVSAGSTVNINITNAPAGTYKVSFVSDYGTPITVSASLHDWYA